MEKFSAVNYRGQTFNGMTFIRPTDKRRQGSVVWEIECECGKRFERVPRFIFQRVVNSCGCKTSSQRAASGAKSRIHHPRISTARSIWQRVYKDGCDFDTFLKLSQLPCHYCGAPPSRTINRYDQDKRHPRRAEADFTYNGLDRIDNAKDHSPENVLPCCTTCNIMRGTLDQAEFLAHVRRIGKHLSGHPA